MGSEGEEKSSQGAAATVFFSYSRADQKFARPIIEILQRAGYSVWWDGLLGGGERYANTTATALANARAVVVLWSKTSLQSHWVNDEAAEARDRRSLVPLSLDGSEPPLGFRQFQTIDVSKSKGHPGSPAMQQLLDAVAALHDRPAIPARPPARRVLIGRREMIAAGVAAVGLGGAAWLWRSRLSGAPGAPANTVAVLPFENISGSPAQDYFADGLSAEVRAALARNTGLRVIGQTSSNVFKARTEDAKTIAAKLGVAFLLDGNVRRAGNRVRVEAELIQGQSGFSNWTQTFDSAIDDIFAVQTEIAAAVTTALTREVAKSTPAAGPGGTTNVAAFEAYLQGRADFALAAGDETDRSALAHFDDAIALDPKFAAAHAARSRTLAAIANQQATGDGQKAFYDQAIAAARQAVLLAPDLADAQSALAYALISGRLDIRGARAPYDRSYALGRGDPDVLGRYALYCANTGRLEEAETAMRQATDLDPLNPRTYWNTGAIRFAAHRYGDAIPAMAHALALNPRMANVNGYIGYCLLLQGKLDEAEKAILKEKSPLTRLPGLAMVAQRRGNAAQAREFLAELVAKVGDNSLYQQAEVKAQWGDAKGAIALLRQAQATHDSGLFLARQDPLLDPVRHDPGLSMLLRDLGFD